MFDNDKLYSVYDQIGENGFERLVAAFYSHVAQDAVLRPLYPDSDLSEAERRLRLFLMQFFGGPTTYSAERGHPALRMRHAPFRIGIAERDAWLKAMFSALEETEIPEPALSVMQDYFRRGADFLRNT